MRISDWSSDVCSSDLFALQVGKLVAEYRRVQPCAAAEIVLRTELEAVHDLLIGRPGRYHGAVVAGVIAAAAETAGVEAIDLGVVVRLPLHADLRRERLPAVAVDNFGIADQRGDRKSTRLKYSH